MFFVATPEAYITGLCLVLAGVGLGAVLMAFHRRHEVARLHEEVAFWKDFAEAESGILRRERDARWDLDSDQATEPPRGVSTATPNAAVLPLKANGKDPR